MGGIIGIDLGTSTSEAAYLKNKRPELIPDSSGKFVIPSIVYLDKQGNIKIGEEALNYAILEPESTVIEVKRLMGSKEMVKLADKLYSPQQISSFILKYIKEYAEVFLGEEVEEAVITVPAYFTNEQRVATREAGILAGFKVDRIINEPTAAALAYGIDHMEDQKYVLVYDLGGGTFDVTVLEMFEGVLDVKASSGNNKLGGKDFDEALLNYFIDEFKKQNGINLSRDRKIMARLKEAAEKCKIQLSRQEKAIVDLPFLAMKNGKPVGLYKEVARDDFERLIRGMVESTLDPVDSALKDAGLKEEDIDTILLIGGSTRIPLVKKIIKDKFRKEPKHEIDPDKAVAMGAAIQAGLKSGVFSAEQDILITDVCPYTLGMEILDYEHGIPVTGVFDPIIKRNTTIPVTEKKLYYTVIDNQRRVMIEVYQGEDRQVKNNTFLGEFILDDIPPAPAGKESIEVQFSYDINGILDVDAIITSTGKKGNIRIDTTKVEMKEEMDIEEEWKKSKYARRVRALIRKAEKKMYELNDGDFEKEEIEDLLHDLKTALANDNEAMAKHFEEELVELLYDMEE